MNLDPIWWSLGQHHGVLELAYGLELHVLLGQHGCVAWWLNDRGAWLRRAAVGDA
jgi:hypothetical protein